MYTVTGMSYMREHNLFIFLRSTHMCMYVYTVLVIQSRVQVFNKQY